jgi:hypothetical protein
MMKLRLCLFGMFLFAALILVPAASADDYQTFNLAWSGAYYSNSASATGQITIDMSALNNPGYTEPLTVSAFTVTVTGADFGNGSYSLADYSYFFLGTNGGTLDFSQEVIGQSTSGDPWGTPSSGNGGDFNIASLDSAPLGTWYFTITPAGGDSGDHMLLTDFSPVSDTPEPGSFILLGSGLAALAGMVRRKIGQRA